ncbi:unnamed protein product [Urochloa decumbens]|uniref:Uncharacterized protein n=1 Tax=Urochloa decumbens TaxID=240449 RepID=A0ABC9DBP8_9POAL
MASNDDQKPLHLLFFPFIAPGHLIPVADMAGVKCSILTTPANAAVIRPAVDRANAALRGAAAGAPAIDISTVPFPDVGLPPGVESAVGVSTDLLLEAIYRLREPFAPRRAKEGPGDGPEKERAGVELRQARERRRPDRRSYGEVFNSFVDLEPDYRGPERCLRWLDGKPDGSVVYVSFGTLARFTLRELARGLQRFGSNFLWVIHYGKTGHYRVYFGICRVYWAHGKGPDSGSDRWWRHGRIGVDASRLRRAGCSPRARSDFPQVGSAEAHSQSLRCRCVRDALRVLEAVSAGVPLVTWPRYSDQFYNDREAHCRGAKLSSEKIAEGIDRVMGDSE